MGTSLAEYASESEKARVKGFKAYDLQLIILAPLMNLFFPYLALELNKDNQEKRDLYLKLLTRQIVDAHLKFFLTIKDIEIIKDVINDSDNLSLRLYDYLIEYIQTIHKSDVIPEKKLIAELVSESSS